MIEFVKVLARVLEVSLGLLFAYVGYQVRPCWTFAIAGAFIGGTVFNVIILELKAK